MARAIPKTDRMEWWPRGNVRPNPSNIREHDESQIDDLAQKMREVGWTYPCLVQEDEDNPGHGMIIAGHGRYEAAPRAGFTEEVKVLVAENWTDAQVAAYVIFDNQIALRSTWSQDELAAAIKAVGEIHGASAMAGLGFTQDALDAVLNPKPERVGVVGSLAEAFGVPPFSVLNAREGWWQKRKAGWIALGIRSELGRADHVEGKKSHRAAPGGGGRLYAGKTADGRSAAATTYGKPVRKPKAKP